MDGVGPVHNAQILNALAAVQEQVRAMREDLGDLRTKSRIRYRNLSARIDRGQVDTRRRLQGLRRQLQATREASELRVCI